MTNLITNINDNFSVSLQDVVTVVTIALIGLSANQVSNQTRTKTSITKPPSTIPKPIHHEITAAELKQCLPASLLQIQDVVVTPEMIYGQGILRLTNLDRAYGMLQNILQKHFPDQPWFLEALPDQPSNNTYQEDGIPVLLRFPRLTDADHYSESEYLENKLEDEDLAIDADIDNSSITTLSKPVPSQNPRSDGPSYSPREHLNHKLINSTLWQLLPWLCFGLTLGLTLLLAYTSYAANSSLYGPWVYCGGIGAIIAVRQFTLWCLYRWHRLRNLPQAWVLPCFGGVGWLGHFSLLPVVPSPSVLWQCAVYPNLVSSGLALILWLCSGDTNHISTSTVEITPAAIPSLHQAWHWQHWDRFPSWGIYLCHKLQIQLQSQLQSYFGGAPITGDFASSLRISNPLAQAGITGLLINAVQMLPLSHTEGRYLLQTILGTHRTRQLLPSIKLLFLGLAVTAQPLLLLPLISTFTISSPLLPTTEDLRDLSFSQEILTFLLWMVVLLFILPMPQLAQVT